MEQSKQNKQDRTDADNTATQAASGGEGDTQAARRYNKNSEAFVQSQRGKTAIEDSAIKSTAEGQESEEAARKAEQKAREKDPQVVRDYQKPAE